MALARALVSQPRVLAFDEPLGALDALTRISMQRLLERVWHDQGFTAILVTHDVAEAVALADRVLVIEDGRIAQDVQRRCRRVRAQRGSAELAALEGAILKNLLEGTEDTFRPVRASMNLHVSVPCRSDPEVPSLRRFSQCDAPIDGWRQRHHRR